MPIKGIGEIKRLPRLGKIRLGIKLQGDKSPYPKAVDYFVCPPEVEKVFGEKPKELRIMFPVEDETRFAQQWYRCYSQTRGLICRGDGETADRTYDTATGELANRDSKVIIRKEVPCQGEDCPAYKKKQCRRVMNLQFLLPEVPGLGVWQLDTSSFHGMVNINNSVDLIRRLLGHISFLPLLLSLVPQKATPEGTTTKTIHVLQLSANITLVEAQRLALLPHSQVLIPAPEPPGDDLYPAEVLEQAETLNGKSGQEVIDELWGKEEPKEPLVKSIPPPEAPAKPKVPPGEKRVFANAGTWAYAVQQDGGNLKQIMKLLNLESVSELDTPEKREAAWQTHLNLKQEKLI